MKLRISKLLFITAIACLATLSTASELQAHPTCSDSSLNGSFAFTLTGTNFGAGVSFALVGRFTADGSGLFSGTGTESVSGTIGHVAFKGSYKVDPDCSGSATLTFQGGGNALLDFVIADDGKQVQLIDADEGTLETGFARKIVSQDRGNLTAVVPEDSVIPAPR
jgi:hypothetical protein